MSIISRNIANTPTDSDYNDLRADLLAGHIHDGTAGLRIKHTDLLFGSGYTIVNNHESIDEHISAASGEHGKLDGVYLAGVTGGNFSVVSGEWINNSDWGCTKNSQYPIGDNAIQLYVNFNGSNKFTCPDNETIATSAGPIKFANTNYTLIVTLKADGSSSRFHKGLTITVFNKFTTYFELGVQNDSGVSIPVDALHIDWVAIGQLEEA